MRAFFNRFPDSGYISAHRGARSIAPENTLLALEKARECGADLWETDVQLSSDGELILLHDETLARTTDVAAQLDFYGRDHRPVAEFSVAELETLNAGNWFLERDPFGTVASGEVDPGAYPRIGRQQIPRLWEALGYCLRYNFPINLEIKAQGSTADTAVAEQVVAMVSAMHCDDLVLISSFSQNYLRCIRELRPNMALGLLVEDEHPADLLACLAELDVDAYNPDRRICDSALVREVESAGFRVGLWTVNDAEQARQFSDAGATFICTDWPQRMTKL